MFRLKSQWKRCLAAFVCIALVLGATPFIIGAANPHFNENIGFGFSSPGQKTLPFANKAINLTNADLSSESGTSGFIFSQSVSGWEMDVNTNLTLGGALNLRQFTRFRTDNIKRNLSYLVRPPMNLGNDNVFVLTNNMFEDTSSKSSFTSTEFEFEADSYYIASIDFYAVQGFGSFYLIPSEELDDGFIPYINLPHVIYNLDLEDDEAKETAMGSSSWRTAQFFIKTDLIATHKFKFAMHLGSMTTTSRGAIYFQNPRVNQVSREAYTTAWDKSQTESQGRFRHLVDEIDLGEQEINKKIDEYETIDNNKIVSRNNFEFERNKISADATNNPEFFGTYSRVSVNAPSIPTLLNFETTTTIHLPNGTRPDRSNNVMLLAASNMHASLKLTEPLLVRRHQIYLISFYSLVSSGGSSATVRIRDVGWRDKRSGEFFDTTHRGVGTLGREALNEWTLNTFFITGETHNDVLLDFEFWVGTESTNTTDYVIIDQESFNIQRVSHEYFVVHGEGLVENNHSLNTNEATEHILNAFFNLGTIRNIESPYPLKASDWELEYAKENEDVILSGIVNTEPEHWTHWAMNRNGGASNYGIATVRPGAINGNSPNNNVYMMQNRGRAWQTLSSTPIVLNSGVINLISFDLFLGNMPSNNFNFWVSAFVKEREVARLDLTNRRSTFEWTTHSFAITESSVTSRELTLVFNMGSETRPCAAAAVFIDNVRMTQTANENDIPRDAVATDLTDPRRFFTSQNAQVGILNDETLYLRNTNRTQAGTVVNTLTETLQGGSFYEYRIRVRIANSMQAFHLCKPEYPNTSDIRDVRNNVKHCTEKHEYGINFSVDGFEGGFKDLKYEDIIEMATVLDTDLYAELVFYIRPDINEELALRVTFGDEYMAVTGEVFIRSFSLTEIDEDLFLEARNELADATHVTFITESYSTDETTPRGPRAPIQWWIIAPSLIMAVTLILALTMFLLRRFKFRVHIDKHHTSYASDDRSARQLRK